MRLWVVLLVTALAGLGLVLSAPGRAAAATDDRIQTFQGSYSVNTSGVLHVQERLVWEFGSSSGRHGLTRSLITREPYDDEHDQVYGISGISVSSPSGAAHEFTTSSTTEAQGREKRMLVKIGDPDRTISAPTATYVISYDVTGAMRNTPGSGTSKAYDELYWDATGFENPVVGTFSATATVPGGAQGASCYWGLPGSRTECSHPFTPSGTATFQQASIPAGQGVTFGVKLSPGLVSDNLPQLEPDGSKTSTATKVLLAAVGVVTALSAVLSPVLGGIWWRRRGRDQRYGGLPPGTVPLPGETAPIVANDPDLPIPVAFSPPKISVAEAGLLVDGQVDTRETAATIIDLAVRRAVTVESSSDRDFSVTLVDPGRATAPHEVVLLDGLFGGAPAGSVVDLSVQGSLQPAHQAMQSAVIDQVATHGWFTKIPSARAAHGIGIGGIAVVAFILFQIGAALLWVLVPLLPVIITVLVVRRKMRRGQRTADGRAVCDQVEGFRTYLATAEAEQLRFEEGEDIFSRYLPWAIAFDLADRWAKICGDLVAMGRLPDTTPYWYYGSYNMSAFNMGFLTGSLTSAASPAAPVGGGSAGTGFGGGSSFGGGGGFSGGGGGGGGTSSW